MFSEITVLAVYVHSYHTNAFLRLRPREFDLYADTK